MPSDQQPKIEFTNEIATPEQIINTMIDLRLAVYELEQQIETLRPDFFAACLALNTEKITLEKAIITKKLTPGVWNYSPEVKSTEALLKQLKRQFQEDHEPIRGRDITWIIKLLAVKEAY
ncbi:hypothetical protein [Gloeothece verrucosa]|uniref:Uncharacterized protein n=1 Tax=Gloeothece verrucosa (strain PCC 7822) TaxID=497965 RepID=E0UM50_GLOV7|nr:hypothetical protein [Gloeothece verrucosa]ADN18030.1 hypothetical protein Cyan7822_6226 [Gloeothece verrucosa PCC 7822]